MKNILDVEVSLFDNYKTPENPKTINLHEWLISNGLRSQIDEIRALTDKKERDAAKAKLPAIAPSGLFSRRCNSAMIKHSGLICIDIDGSDNTDVANFDTLKTQLSHIVNVAYCGVSIGGGGYFVLIPIEYPDQHAQHFDALRKDFAKLGIKVDKLCRDVSRLRGASFDDEAYFNLSPITYSKLITVQKITAKPLHYSGDVGGDVERLIVKICNTGTNITESYVDWFAVGCALASELGESGRAMFHSVSSQSSKYEFRECDRQYTQCLRDKRGYTISTFFSLCKDNNVMFK